MILPLIRPLLFIAPAKYVDCQGFYWTVNVLLIIPAVVVRLPNNPGNSDSSQYPLLSTDWLETQAINISFSWRVLLELFSFRAIYHCLIPSPRKFNEVLEKFNGQLKSRDFLLYFFIKFFFNVQFLWCLNNVDATKRFYLVYSVDVNNI